MPKFKKNTSPAMKKSPYKMKGHALPGIKQSPAKVVPQLTNPTLWQAIGQGFKAGVKEVAKEGTKHLITTGINIAGSKLSSLGNDSGQEPKSELHGYQFKIGS